MGCGQSSATVPSASTSVSADKSEKFVKSNATVLVSVGTNTDTASQKRDVSENPQFLLSEEKEGLSRPQVDRMVPQEETNLMFVSIDDTDDSYIYSPENNWTHFSDTDGETDGVDEANVEMKNEPKSNKKDSVTEGAKLENQRPRVYTRKDLEYNSDLIKFGRKIYSRSLFAQLVEVST